MGFPVDSLGPTLADRAWLRSLAHPIRTSRRWVRRRRLGPLRDGRRRVDSPADARYGRFDPPYPRVDVRRIAALYRPGTPHTEKKKACTTVRTCVAGRAARATYRAVFASAPALRRGRVLMPVGYWLTVAVISWGVACALTGGACPVCPPPSPRCSSANCRSSWRICSSASTVLALAEGDLASPGGAVGAAVALPWRWTVLWSWCAVNCAAHVALQNTGRPRRLWGRILRVPFFPGQLDVVRVRGLAYGDGPDRTLDVYHRRDRPSRVPALFLHFHDVPLPPRQQGPRGVSCSTRRRTRRRGFVCVSAN